MNEKVSIIIAAYNAANYIGDTLNSILSQTWKDLEIIVVNDGSKDNTLELLHDYGKQGVIIVNQQNKGQDAALNAGFLVSTGTYIKFMDADDLINPVMLELQVQALRRNPEKIAYSEWYRFFGNKPLEGDESKKMGYWKDMSSIDFLLADDDGPMLQCGIMLLPRKIIEEAGLWDERLVLYNDTEFFTRIILKSKGIVFTHGAKLYYRSGMSTSLSAQNSRKFFESTFLATNLIADMLLSVENSQRVKQCISNIYFRRLYDMYPLYPDLAAKHTEKIEFYGKPSLVVRGGLFHNLISTFFGWRAVKYAHQLKRHFFNN